MGGHLTLQDMGGFDKLNPFTLKGAAPALLGALVFETLMTSSLDEPFAQYGLLAEDVVVAEDWMSVTFRLNAKAQFSDGTPVTAEDVKFSLETLKSDQASPFHASYYRDIERAEIIDARSVRFHFKQYNRELPLIAGQLPILSKKFFAKHSFKDLDLTIPVGSGPYVVEKVESGKSVLYRRNPNYWGWGLPVNQGFYNFDSIGLKVFKDPVVALEAFKAGEFDFITVYNSKQWARDYEGKQFDSGALIKEKLPHRNNQGMQAFIFNLRKPLFQDQRVRQALALAFDFEWSNHNLFYDQYTRDGSFFSNSEMAARPGPPQGAVLNLLEPFRKQLPAEVFEGVRPPPSTTPPGSLRGNLRQAMRLLKQAGWKLGPDRVLVNAKGERLAFDFLLAQPAFERVMAPFNANLKKLGVEMTYRTVDASLYQQRVQDHDFDMMVGSFPQSQSPGNEQIGMWTSQSADVKGSRNLLGLKNPVVDALVEQLIQAKDRDGLVAACRALDRVLMAGDYLIPNWHIPYHRVAYASKLKRPAKPPLYYTADGWLLSWWLAKP
ncbi:putative extracellular solute-binding protein [Magnetofaba australis IT-1]|uniref:Putative extracellular solute-binding protein n=1 Tax=Magnetofaba australis IT-1 TaxID=1434232 RepID=A0A1Y2K5Y5_9PROT|nr:putative extracellular solute-binding protein [Magnetofaba australis IT-1]